jgi:hypothetical protein
MEARKNVWSASSAPLASDQPAYPESLWCGVLEDDLQQLDRKLSHHTGWLILSESMPVSVADGDDRVVRAGVLPPDSTSTGDLAHAYDTLLYANVNVVISRTRHGVGVRTRMSHASQTRHEAVTSLRLDCQHHDVYANNGALRI